MLRTPASAAAKINLLVIAFAFAAAPVGFGSAAVCALAGNRLISYWRLALNLGWRLALNLGWRLALNLGWRLALNLGWAIVPLAVLTRIRRCQRQVSAEQLPGGRAAESVPR